MDPSLQKAANQLEAACNRDQAIALGQPGTIRRDWPVGEEQEFQLPCQTLGNSDYVVGGKPLNLRSMAESKDIVFTRYARERAALRGATEDDVVRAVHEGKPEAAHRGLSQFRLNLEFQKKWAGNWYAVQQIVPVLAEEADRLVVITVYAYYF